MTVIAYQIPDDKIQEVSRYIAKAGGEKIALENTDLDVEEDEVTHEYYFGENIRRLINAFKR